MTFVALEVALVFPHALLATTITRIVWPRSFPGTRYADALCFGRLAAFAMGLQRFPRALHSSQLYVNFDALVQRPLDACRTLPTSADPVMAGKLPVGGLAMRVAAAVRPSYAGTGQCGQREDGEQKERDAAIATHNRTSGSGRLRFRAATGGLSSPGPAFCKAHHS